MKFYTKLTFTLLLLAGTLPTFAQENTTTDSVNLQLQQMQTVLNTLSKIKLSGYIQAQFQFANAVGIKTYEGGNFAPDAGNRFMVRRGRLKISHNGKYSTSVLQLDATEKGVGIKDAYIILTEPWLKTFSVTTGIFDRPFGFEVSYSSSIRESPERGRMSQILFPGERDLGAMFTIQTPENSALNFLRIDAAILNGNGIAQDFDSSKDFIGRLRLNNMVNSETVNLSVAGSYYKGRWVQGSNVSYQVQENASGTETFLPFYDDNAYHSTPREYFGGDAQLKLNWLAGTTILRGEYITGTQSGFSSSTTSPSTGNKPDGPAYIRNFDGAYFYFIQNIAKSKHQLVVKYDWYDPNTDVDANQIGLPENNFGAAEIKYSSLGFGWNFLIDNNFKILAFYQMVENEKTNLSGFTKDIKDDVVTIRLQHKF